MSKLVSEEELEVEFGDKFIGRHLLFELDLYDKERLKAELDRLADAHPDYLFTATPNSPSEPDGFHIRWQMIAGIPRLPSALPTFYRDLHSL